MSAQPEQPQKSEARPPPECDAAALFELLWASLVDLLGTAATATVIRRAIKGAAPRAPELREIVIARNRLEYQYVLPPSWKDHPAATLQGLRELAREMQPLLREFTGPVVLGRLRAIPLLLQCGLLPPEDDR